jgi:hypothetical protein
LLKIYGSNFLSVVGTVIQMLLLRIHRRKGFMKSRPPKTILFRLKNRIYWIYYKAIYMCANRLLRCIGADSFTKILLSKSSWHSLCLQSWTFKKLFRIRKVTQTKMFCCWPHITPQDRYRHVSSSDMSGAFLHDFGRFLPLHLSKFETLLSFSVPKFEKSKPMPIRTF